MRSSDKGQQSSGSSDWTPSHNPWLIAGAVMLVTFMEVLDTSIAAVALPYIAGSLSATNDEATWVLTSYLVANAVVLPASAWFSRRFGRKRFLLACTTVFTLASLATGASGSLSTILLARAIQGAGGGALQPLSQAILLESFPPARRGAATAIFALGVVVAPVLGPTLGGWLTDRYAWRWAFYINVPVGALAVLLISRLVEDPPYIREARPGRIDAIGLGLLAVWLGALQIILDKGQEDDWFAAAWIRWTAALLVLAFIAFLIRELSAKNPLVDLAVFADRNFALGCVLMGLFGVVIYGVVTVLPLFYQTLMGYSALSAGVAVAPRGMGAVVVMPMIALLTNRVDNRYLLALGFAGFGLTSYWLGNLTLQIAPDSMFWPIIISGMAAGFIFVPITTVSVGTLSNERLGNATGLFNLVRNVGGSVGISLLSTLVARRAQSHRTELVGALVPGSPIFEERLATLRAVLSRTADPAIADDRANAIIARTLDTQSSYWAYVDDFRYLAIGCFMALPIVFLLRRVKAVRGAPSLGH